MQKTFTILDLEHYIQEISFTEDGLSARMHHQKGPSQSTIQNLLRYSSALNVLKTSTVGNVYQLTN